MNSLGIIIFFTIALATASVTSLTVEGPQQAMAKSSNSVMKSLIANTTRIGVLSMPITCNSLGDIMGAVSGVIANATAGGGNQTNSTQGMSGVMGALSGMLGNATTTAAAAGGNQTSSMQEMMTSGMQNMSQGKLQHLKDVVFCSPANEKMIRSMMK
ncbi:MAG: hypothetical protein ACJ71H_20870 [Nitrososphaeraceae archaeon]